MKRHKLKSYLLIVTMLLFGLMTGCRGTDDKKKIDDNENTQDEVGDNEIDENTEDEADDQTENGDNEEAGLETIEETVLFDQEGVRVTAQGIANDDFWGKALNVLVENNSDKNIGIQCNSLVINNYMITDLFSASVAIGKKSNEAITLYSSSLEAAGIDTISEIAVSFHVFDDESYETLFDTEEIVIQTSAYGTVDQPALDDGKELLNNGGIRIVGKYVDEDTFLGTGVLLFLENKSEADVLVQCDNMSINGFMVEPLFSTQVNQGRMALSTIEILDSDLEENNITEVQDIELVFNIINPETYETIYDSDPISFSIQE